MSLFLSVSLFIIGLTVLALIFRALKQPLLPVYLLAGFLIGPIFHIVPEEQLSSLEFFSVVGIAFLLFLAGLELDLAIILKNFKVSLIGFIFATLNVLFFIFIFALIPLFDFMGSERAIVATAFSFSSTLLIVKALSDKRRLSTTLGYLSLAILLAQDLIAIFILALFSVQHFEISANLAGLAILILLGIGGGYFVFPRLFYFVSFSEELIFLVSLAVLFFFSLIGNSFGLSPVIGAFIAGVSLSPLVYKYEISSKLKPLRDFFVILLFLSLGLQIQPKVFNELFVPFLALFGLTIFAKPLIYTLLGCAFKLSRWLSVEEALVLTPSSEFSLIISSNLSQPLFSLSGFNFLASSFLASYFYEYLGELSSFFVKIWDKILPYSKSRKYIEDEEMKTLREHIVIFGGHRMGGRLIKKLLEMNKKIVLIDHNPDIIKKFKGKVITIYGDALEKDVREKAHLESASIVISTIPDLKINLLLIKEVNRLNPQSFVYVTAGDYDEALILYEEGADFVILPHFLGAEQVNVLLEDFDQAIERLAKVKEDHLNKLNEIKKEI